MTVSPNKKIILSLVDLAFDKLGSFEILLLNLSKSLMEHNFESVLVFNKKVPDRFKDKCNGVVIDFLARSNNPFYFYYQLAKIMRKHKPEIVHLGFYPILSPMTLLIYLCGCHNIIVTDHLSGEAAKHHGIKKWLVFLRNKFFSQLTKNITCVSDYVLERDKLIPGIDTTKLKHLYLGVSLDRFRPISNTKAIRQELNIPQHAFVISTAAHLIKEKGIDNLIRAAKLITENHNNVLFLIAGEGKDANELKMLTRDLRLDSKVVFLGLRDDTEKIFSASDVFVCPSVWLEAFGLTNIEAMACGIPVIATQVGGIPEIIVDNITGILVEPKNTQALVIAIERLYKDPGLRREMGQQSLERVKQYFDLEQTISETIAIYKSCV